MEYNEEDTKHWNRHLIKEEIKNTIRRRETTESIRIITIKENDDREMVGIITDYGETWIGKRKE